MTRKWIDYPADIPLETKFGTVYLTVTERKHIVVDASSNGRFIVVNNVEYHTRFHLLKQDDGSYQLDKHGIKGDRTHRYSTGNFWKDEMTSAAKKKVQQVLIPLVNSWAVSNPEIFEKAEYAHVNNQIISVENEAKQLATELLAKQKELGEKAEQVRLLARNIGEKYSPINSVNPVELLKNAVAIAIPEITTESYRNSTDPETLELEVLGILISKFTEWSGNLILSVAIAALEDANFSREASELKTILQKLETYVEID